MTLEQEAVNATARSQNGERPTPLAGRVALVTGATSGIGRAIAVALSLRGAHVCVVGRDAGRLADTVASIRNSSPVTEYVIDLTADHEITSLGSRIEQEIGRLDFLVHSAGVISVGSLEHASVDKFDIQYATNVRAPYVITQQLLHLLIKTRGQVVFINSTLGLNAKRPEVVQYSATKHALKAIADSLREEVNSKGVRVLTVYVGRTATPMQQRVSAEEHLSYDVRMLLQPPDVAHIVLQALMLPSTAEITDISMRPMRKA